MKKLVFAFSLILGSVMFVQAQDSTATDQGAGSTELNQGDMADKEYTEKEAIAATELPAMISQQLQGQDYSGWTVGNTYRKEKDGQTMYAVELSKDGETKIVKFDAQGNKLKEKKKDK